MNTKSFREQYLRRFKSSMSPLEGVFELTGRCNFNCKMCYVHTKTNAEFLKTEKDGDWWISQMDAACNKGMIFALLTGGECLLHPDFRRIYLHLRNKGVYVRINTNGFLLTKANIQFFKDNPPLEIQVTIYGANDSGYKQVTGVSAFQQVKSNILNTVAAGLNVRCSLTPNQFAPGETKRIIELLKELGLPYSINEAMFTPYDKDAQQMFSSHNVGVEEKISYLKSNADPKCTSSAEKNLPPVGGGSMDEHKGVRCTAGRVSFAISHDGCMMPCTAMYHLRKSLNTALDFENTWNQMLKISSEYLMPRECEGCAYRKVCLSCPVLRGGSIGNGHCDPAVCEMTRSLVISGVKTLELADDAVK